MARQEIRVLIDAEALCNHTLCLTGNLNNFPKKYRFTLVDELVRKSIEIYDRIQDANSTWDTQKRMAHASYCTDQRFRLYYNKKEKELDV